MMCCSITTEAFLPPGDWRNRVFGKRKSFDWPNLLEKFSNGSAYPLAISWEVKRCSNPCQVDNVYTDFIFGRVVLATLLKFRPQALRALGSPSYDRSDSIAAEACVELVRDEPCEPVIEVVFMLIAADKMVERIYHGILPQFVLVRSMSCHSAACVSLHAGSLLASQMQRVKSPL